MVRRVIRPIDFAFLAAVTSAACAEAPSESAIEPSVGSGVTDEASLKAGRDIVVRVPDAVELARAPRLHASLPAPAQKAIDAAATPLLLPDEPGFLSSTVVTSGPTWTAAHLQAGGVTV